MPPSTVISMVALPSVVTVVSDIFKVTVPFPLVFNLRSYVTLGTCVVSGSAVVCGVGNAGFAVVGGIGVCSGFGVPGFAVVAPSSFPSEVTIPAYDQLETDDRSKCKAGRTAIRSSLTSRPLVSTYPILVT